MFRVTVKTTATILLCVLPAGAGNAAEAEDLIVQFHTGTPTTRRLAIKQLTTRDNPFLFSFFVKQIQHEDIVIRAHAYEGLSRYSQALPLLKDGLKDQSMFVIQSTLPLFSRFASEESVHAVLPFLDFKERKIQVIAIRVLGNIGEVSAIKTIVPLLEHPEEVVRVEAIRSILNIARNNISLLYKDFDAEFTTQVKDSAFKRVSSILDITLPFVEKSIRSKIASLKEKEYAIALFALYSGILPEKLETFSLFEEDADYLLKAESISGRLYSVAKFLMGDVHTMPDQLRGLIIDALENYRDPQIVSLLREGLNDKFFLARIAAINGLLSLNASGEAQQIFRLIHDTNHHVRVAALRALCFLPPKQGISSLIPMLKEPDIEIQWHAARVLGKNQKLSPPLLNKLFSSRYARTRAVALRYINTSSDKKGVYSFLETGVRDMSPLVRKEVLRTLSNLPTDPQKAHILNLLLSDTDIHIKRRALKEARNDIACFTRPASSSILKKTLAAMLRDPDSVIRERSCELLAALGGEESLPPLKAMLRVENNPRVIKAILSAMKQLLKTALGVKSENR